MIEKINFYLNQYAVLITILIIFMLIFDVFIVMPVGSDISKRENQIKAIDAESQISKTRNMKLLAKKKVLKKDARSLVNSISEYNDSFDELSFTHFINERLKENKIEYRDMRFQRSDRKILHSKYCFVEFSFYSELDAAMRFLEELRNSEYFITAERISTVFDKEGKLKGSMKFNLHMLSEKRMNR